MSEAHDSGNPMVKIGVGIFAILAFTGLGLFIFGPGLGGLGDYYRHFMVAVTQGMQTNVPLAIFIFLIPVVLLLFPIMMGIRALLKG